MKLLDGGATVLLVISVVYFVSHLLEEAKPKQCLHQEEIKQGVTVAEWVNCDSIERGDE